MANAKWRGGGDHFIQNALGFDADSKLIFEGLKVDVAGVIFDG